MPGATPTSANPNPLSDNQANQLVLTCSQRRANTDLARPSRNFIRQQPVDPNANQYQRDATEESGGDAQPIAH